MFHLEEGDFQALENFKLLWRWTDSECTILPETVLTKIHVLQPRKAQQLEEYLLPHCQALSLYTYKPIPENFSLLFPFEWIRHLRLENQSMEKVQHWLVSQGIPDYLTMLISWEKTVAVTVPWGIFCHYWDDFCYAGSDDVCIASQCGTWHLVYYHEHIFLAGKLIEISIQ